MADLLPPGGVPWPSERKSVPARAGRGRRVLGTTAGVLRRPRRGAARAHGGALRARGGGTGLIAEATLTLRAVISNGDPAPPSRAVQDRVDLSVRDRANEPEPRMEVAGVLADLAQLVVGLIEEGRDDRSIRGYGAE